MMREKIVHGPRLRSRLDKMTASTSIHVQDDVRSIVSPVAPLLFRALLARLSDEVDGAAFGPDD